MECHASEGKTSKHIGAGRFAAPLRKRGREGRQVAVFVYNLVILLTLPVAVVYLAIQLLAHRKYRESLFPRLGYLPRVVEVENGRQPVFWIHAVSVGEVMAATPLVKRLRQRYPQGKLLVSTVTQTGQATARQKIPEADQVFYFPFDLPWVVDRVIRKIKPSIFVFLETEIWPNFLFALAREGVPSLMVNGRISSRSYKGYRLLSPFFRMVLSTISLFSVQTDLDRKRLMALGGGAEKVFKTGNMKYDQATLSSPRNLEEMKKGLKLSASCDLIVAGSTHDGEEEALVSCYKRLSQRYPHTRLLLAPRHLERLQKVEDLLKAQGLTPVRKTKIESCPCSTLASDTVILLDTLGELQQLYAVATLVFVGGSLVPVGGHNVLEPAAFARPILFGPYMANFHEIVQFLMEHHAAFQVTDAEQLLTRMGWLLDHPAESASMGKQAREVVLQQQGAVEKNLDLIQSVLTRHP